MAKYTQKQNFYPEEMISPDEAASRMGCGRQKVETGIRNKEFPFGAASQNENGRWRYFIPRAAFEHWMHFGCVPVVITADAILEKSGDE